MKYEVRCGRTVADTLKTYVTVEASCAEQAQEMALDIIHSGEYDESKWVFDQCGDTVESDTAEVISRD
jgi:hypothetical protein